MDAYAEAADEIMIEIAGRTLPVEFRVSPANPLWLGDAGAGPRLYHWNCRVKPRSSPMLVLVTIAPCSSSCLIAKRILSIVRGFLLLKPWLVR